MDTTEGFGPTHYRRWVIRETYFTELVCLGFSSLRYHIKLVLRELVIVRKSLQMNKDGIFGRDSLSLA